MAKIEIFYTGNLSTRCIHTENGAEIVTDAPKDNQGRGEMFSPTDLVAAALGSCVLTLMGIMANKLKVDISGAKADVEKEMSKDSPRRIVKISVKVSCPKDFSSEIKAQLEKAGGHCPVHHSLHPDISQQIHFSWGVL
jgi:putative redox protein